MHKSDGSGMRLTKENPTYYVIYRYTIMLFTTAQDGYAEVTEQHQNTIIVTL